MSVRASISIVKIVPDNDKAKDFYEQVAMSLISPEEFFNAANPSAGKLSLQMNIVEVFPVQEEPS